MRKLVVVAVVAILLVGAALAVALWFVPEGELRSRLEREIAAALGRETSIAELELSFFPLPAAHVRGLRIAGESKLLPPLAEVDSVRLRLALWPLLRGRVALASLTLDRPRLVVPVDASGRPTLTPPRRARAPRAAEEGGGAPQAGGAERAAQPPESAASGAALLAIDAFHVRDGSARVGRYRLEAIDLDGALQPPDRARISGSFALSEIARFEGVRVDLEGLGRADWDALVRARVFGGDLDGLARLARLGSGFGGKFDLEIDDLRLLAFAPKEGSIRARLHDLAVRRYLTTVDGVASLEADATGRWKLDLTDAGLHYADFGKPRGTPLSLEGPFPSKLRERFSARLELPGNALDITAHYTEVPRIDVQPATLALDALAPILGLPIAGKIQLAPTLVVVGPPPAWDGKATLDEVSYPVRDTSLIASGGLIFERDELVGPALRVRVADQPLEVALRVSLARWFEAKLQGMDLDVERLAAGLFASRDFAGKAKLSTHVTGHYAGERSAEGLSGNGHVEIAPGRIRGFSLLRQAFGELAALPVAIAVLRGKDLSRYEEEEFQSLTADYALGGGKLSTRNLRIVYKNATAELAGDVNLADGALRLSGRVLLAPEVDAALAAGTGAKVRVIPIAGIGGTIREPRLRLDEEAALAIGAALSGSERIKQQLDEKLGPGAGEAVEGLLDVLRGEPKREAAP